MEVTGSATLLQENKSLKLAELVRIIAEENPKFWIGICWEYYSVVSEQLAITLKP